MSIRTILAASAAVAALTAGSAFAADLPSRTMAPPAPYVAAVPVFTWTGFYVGVNAGAAFNSNSDVTYVPGGFPAGPPAAPNIVQSGNGNDTNFTGGGQIGYNWQVASFVFGVEADLNYLHQSNQDGAYVFTAGNYYNGLAGAYTGYTLSGTHHSDYLGTVRGRLGYAVDRALFYVTGGLAYGGANGGGGTFVLNGTPNATYTSTGGNSTRTGWVLGGGIEYAIMPNWTIKGEYLYADLGKNTTTYVAGAGAPAGTSFTVSNRDRVSIARIGVNYKF